MTFVIRRLAASDRAEWNDLWQGYITFYQSSVPTDITELTWSRLLDPMVPLFGWCAVDQNDRLIGFTHALEHHSTWSATPYVYLEDLFVDPNRRIGGVGRALIEAVYQHADSTGSPRVYWHTKADNHLAQRLYDKIASDRSFIVYKR
jgi:GNAT superfamily N-acetyltransferase